MLNYFITAVKGSIAITVIIFVGCLTFSNSASAQQQDDQPTSAIDYLSKTYEVNPSQLTIAKSHTDSKNQKTFYYVQQVVDGVDIQNAVTTVVEFKGKYYSVGHRLFDTSGIDVSSSKSEGSTLINVALNDVLGKQSQNISPRLSSNPNRYQTLYDAELSSEDIYTKPIYYVDAKGGLIYGMEVNVWSDADAKWYQRIVNGEDLSVIKTQGWTIECSFGLHTECTHSHHSIHNTANNNRVAFNGTDSSYHVLAIPVESPVYGSRSIVESPWNDALNASPYGWHDLNGIAGPDTMVTFGNNVRAYEDTGNNNEPGIMPDGGVEFCFDFPFDDVDTPATYLDASTVNLFYWNNLVHDIVYQYGFTEEAGNFQLQNYTGVDGDDDYVNAESQDGSGTNNANFSTPPDGDNGRMQMYLWNFTSNADSLEITLPSSIAGNYSAQSGAFGPSGVSVEDTIVLVEPNTLCDPITNGPDVDGQIAMIDRGDCTFISKVEAAQEAGAVAVIICNNTGTGTISMSGTSDIITIPSVMVSLPDCDSIKVELANTTVEGRVVVGPSGQRDSDFDNGVIVHEYGHGISIRLTGGSGNSGCLSNSEQMGEGWSDYFGLVLTIESGDVSEDPRGIGNYLQGEDETGGGIRPNPYTTDMAINPHTYNDISSVSIPHGVGSVWCAMLWDMTWDLIDVYGYDADIYDGTGGNNIALQLVIDGLKLQPCSPGFIDGRDAILLADEINNGGANQCLIWEAFARRGLGYSADQGSQSSVSDGTEAFDLPVICRDTIAVVKSVDKAIAVNGDTLSYSLFAFNQTGMDQTMVTVHDTLDSQLDYVAASLNMGDQNSGVIGVDLGTLEDDETADITFKAVVNTGMTTITYYDPIEYANSTWSPSTGQGGAPFSLSTVNPNLDNQSWFVPNVGADNTHYITSEDFVLGSGQGLSFYHDYDTEGGWDGGYVEYSDDGGVTWTNLEGFFIKNDYNSILGQNQNDDIANQPAFSGSSDGYINSIIDLSHLEGETIRFRFTFGSDDNTFSHGWYIDDVSIYSIATIDNVACIEYGSGEMYCDTVSTAIETECSRFYKLYPDVDLDGDGVDTDSMYTCDLVAGYSQFKGDCDDTDPSLSSIQVELCDGIDNDCDGLIDEVCTGMLVCQDDQLVLIVDDEVYNIADSTIYSSAFIQQLDSTYYYAGDTITLGAGFEVPTGKTFNAIIEGCSDN